MVKIEPFFDFVHLFDFWYEFALIFQFVSVFLLFFSGLFSPQLPKDEFCFRGASHRVLVSFFRTSKLPIHCQFEKCFCDPLLNGIRKKRRKKITILEKFLVKKLFKNKRML